MCYYATLDLSIRERYNNISIRTVVFFFLQRIIINLKKKIIVFFAFFTAMMQSPRARTTVGRVYALKRKKKNFYLYKHKK